MDSTDCGKRFLCELAAMPADQRSKEDNITIRLFQVITLSLLTSGIPVSAGGGGGGINMILPPL